MSVRRAGGDNEDVRKHTIEKQPMGDERGGYLRTSPIYHDV